MKRKVQCPKLIKTVVVKKARKMTEAEIKSAQEQAQKEDRQRKVMDGIAQHPERHILAPLIFNRMPANGFVDALNVLAPRDGQPNYDDLLPFYDCRKILAKFGEEDPTLNSIRARCKVLEALFILYLSKIKSIFHPVQENRTSSAIGIAHFLAWQSPFPG